MSLENLTTYTEADQSNGITVSSTSASFTSINTGHRNLVAKDKGSNYFNGDFTHHEDFTISSIGGDNGFVFVWGMGNLHAYWDEELQDYVYDIPCLSEYLDSGESCLALYAVKYSGTLVLNLHEQNGANGYDTNHSISTGTTYYPRIIRDETVGTYGQLRAEVYSDSGRTDLLFTLTLTLHAKNDFRIIHALSTWPGASGQTASGSVNNLDLAPSTTQTYDYTATGGFIAGGSAASTKSSSQTGTGGGVFAGTAVSTKNSIHIATGGGVWAGDSIFGYNGASQYDHVASGGGEFGGSAVVSWSSSFTASGGPVFGGTAPYSFNITTSTQEVIWEIYDSSGNPITGAALNTGIRLRRTPDGKLLDWADLQWKTSGWTTLESNLSEVDATYQQGVYKKEISMTALPDGKYQAFLVYNGTPKLRSSGEFLIKDGLVWDVRISDKVDDTVTSRASQASVDALSLGGGATLSEIEASTVLAKEATSQDIRTKTETINWADIGRLLGYCLENHVEDDITRDGNGNKVSSVIYLYDSPAHAALHDKATGLIGTLNISAAYSHGKMNLFKGIKA